MRSSDCEGRESVWRLENRLTGPLESLPSSGRPGAKKFFVGIHERAEGEGEIKKQDKLEQDFVRKSNMGEAPGKLQPIVRIG